MPDFVIMGRDPSVNKKMAEALEHKTGVPFRADTHLCPECDEPVDGATHHPDCCPHDEVEDDDGRDGVGGRQLYWCVQCDREVRLIEEEDGAYWETI